MRRDHITEGKELGLPPGDEGEPQKGRHGQIYVLLLKFREICMWGEGWGDWRLWGH